MNWKSYDPWFMEFGFYNMWYDIQYSIFKFVLAKTFFKIFIYVPKYKTGNNLSWRLLDIYYMPGMVINL